MKLFFAHAGVRASRIPLGLSLALGCTLMAAVPLRAQTAPPTLSVNDIIVNEGNSGTVNAVFTVSLSAASTTPVTVKYVTADSTAMAGADYTALPITTLTFAPGQTSKTGTVVVKGDIIDESNENFKLKLSAPTGATIADASGNCRIEDDDTSRILVTGATVKEGNAGTVPMVFTLKLSTLNDRVVTVKASTAAAYPNPAMAGVDYTALTGQLVTFPAGTTTQTMTVDVKGDTLDEYDESVRLALSSPTIATLGANTPGTITDDDLTPSLSVTDATVLEGKSGGVNAALQIKLSAPSAKTVTVQSATANGTATAGADYTALPATTWTFAPGQTIKPVNVSVQGDVIDELDETFFVNLTAPVNATIADASGTGTITDDDTSAISAIGASVTEGNTGTVPMAFTLKLSAPNSREVKVKAQTTNAAASAATAGADYTALAANVVTFAPGETSKTLTVLVNGDVLDEENERVALALTSPINAVLGSNYAGTIADDDALPKLSIADASIVEGNSGSKLVAVKVSLNVPSGRPVIMKYATADDTATAGSDYTAQSDEAFTIPAGQTFKSILIPVFGDTTVEPTEQFKIVLSQNQVSTLVDGTGVVKITNDDNSAPSEEWDYYDAGGGYLAGQTLDETYDVLANDSDVDGDALHIVSVTQPTGDFSGAGTVKIVNNQIHVVCANLDGGYGVVEFDYKVSDGKTTSDGFVYIAFYAYEVPDDNEAPNVQDDSYDDGKIYQPGAAYSATIDVTANDSDPEGDEFHLWYCYGLGGDFEPGTASIEEIDNKVVLKVTKLPDHSGTISFIYDVLDDHDNSATGYVTVSYTVGSGFKVQRSQAAKPSGRTF